MPSLRSLGATYAILASPIWQLAQAAPALRATESHAFDTHVPAFKPYFDPPGYELDASRNADQAYAQAYLHGASLKGVQFVTDPKSSHSVNEFLLKFQDWLNPKRPVLQPLGMGHENDWLEIAKLKNDVLGDTSIEAWYKANVKNFKKPPNFDDKAAEFEFMTNRVRGKQDIWWKSEQITDWQKKKYDWRAMINVGDILEFGNRGPWTIEESAAQKKKPLLQELIDNGNWHVSWRYRKEEGPVGWKEFQTLHMFQDAEGRDMIDRMELIIPRDVPRRRPEDDYSPAMAPAPEEVHRRHLKAAKIARASPPAPENFPHQYTVRYKAP